MLDLLHRFEEFAVLTIDKFNLRLIRTFQENWILPPEFEVIIEESKELEMVLDGLLQDLGTPKQQYLTKLALQFAKSRLKNGDKWDFKRGVVELSQQLTKEVNKRTFLSNYRISVTITNVTSNCAKTSRLKNRKLSNKCKEFWAFFLNENIHVNVQQKSLKG